MSISKVIVAAALWGFGGLVYAQDISGIWQNIDDKTGSPKGIIEIRKEANGTFTGKITKITPRPGYVPRTHCIDCPPPYTNKPILGMDILTGLQHSKDLDYVNGHIIDPLSGKVYSTKAKLSPNGKRLQLRGYVGVSALGRTQIWIRQE